jgi:hypothetical protein
MLWTVATLAFAAILLWLSPASAEPSPGKSSAFAFGDDVVLPDGPTGEATLATAVIAKGKKKHALVIEAAMQVNTSVGVALPSLRVEVNGVAAVGPTVGLDCKNENLICPLSGSWWLDLDTAEAANPGVFVGEPLTVELKGGANTYAPPIASQADVSLTVLLVKR